LIMKSGALTTSSKEHDAVEYNDVKKLLSEKWKACREKKQLTLEDVAKDIDISASYLSRIENGQANVSLEVLNKLANYYDESLLSFLVEESTESRVVKRYNGEIVDIGLDGVSTESLVDQKKRMMFPMLFTAEPGCGSMKAHRHHGEEFIHILKGKMHITLNSNEEYELSSGDSFYFNSYEYHKWHNSGKTKLELIWVHTHCESK
ncbi:MAG TPA: XRE family transcriptional regulator, partial [Negativicutes bacterium]|nr:XRE family transcriptional regulator [Negativicutes bacterium]